MVLPPLDSRFDVLLLEVRIPFRETERPGDGVLTVALELLGIGVIFRGKEGGHHDDLIYTQQIGIERSLEGIILRNVILPVFCPLSGLHFQNGGRSVLLVYQQVVPHAAEDLLRVEEISPSLVEILRPVHIGRSDEVAHEVRTLHVLRLFRFNGLTGLGVDGILERSLVGPSASAPDLKRGRPSIQTQHRGETGSCQLLRLARRGYLDGVILIPLHNYSSSSPLE